MGKKRMRVNVSQKMSDTANKFLLELREDLSLVNSSIQEWNVEYFRNQKDRYLSDLSLVQRYYRDGDILEIGGCPFHFTSILKKSGYPVVSLDIAPERFHAFIEKHNIKVIKCDIENEKLPFKDYQFRLILFNEVFEHLRIDPISTVEEINRVLHPEGFLILTTPNLCSLNNMFSFIHRQGFDEPYQEFEKLHTLGHMGHVREYTPGQVKQFLHKTGFEVIKTEYRMYRKMRKKFNLFLRDVCMKIRPQWQDFQVQIACKSSC